MHLAMFAKGCEWVGRTKLKVNTEAVNLYIIVKMRR